MTEPTEKVRIDVRKLSPNIRAHIFKYLQIDGIPTEEGYMYPMVLSLDLDVYYKLKKELHIYGFI